MGESHAGWSGNPRILAEQARTITEQARTEPNVTGSGRAGPHRAAMAAVFAAEIAYKGRSCRDGGVGLPCDIAGSRSALLRAGTRRWLSPWSPAPVGRCPQSSDNGSEIVETVSQQRAKAALADRIRGITWKQSVVSHFRHDTSPLRFRDKVCQSPPAKCQRRDVMLSSEKFV
jgi:hypothetical protein